MNQYTSKKDKANRMFQFPRKSHDKRYKKNDDTQRVAAFYNSGDVFLVVDEFHSGFGQIGHDPGFGVKKLQ